MKKLSSILWGIVFIIAGVCFALNSLEIVDINIFFDGWWTLFLIIPSTIGLFSEREKTGNLIVLLVGVFLLLCCQGILEFSMLWKLALPAVVIIIGFKMIFSSIFNRKSAEIMSEMKQSGAELKTACATFSGQNIDCSGEIFNGADLTAVFGGIKLDLRGAVIQRDCVIETCSIFGGIDIFLPDNVNVKVSSNSLFGGMSSKRHGNSPDNTVTVYVNGTCLFGGVDIK